jgi:hypothetical protein
MSVEKKRGKHKGKQEFRIRGPRSGFAIRIYEGQKLPPTEEKRTKIHV